LEPAEERYKREAPIRVWQQQNSQWQAESAEHQRKVDAALSKFRKLEEIGRAAAMKITDPQGKPSTLASVLASGSNIPKGGM
jgi:hypothetical protein